MVSYREAEQMVFNSLNTLIKDSGVLRDYAGISLQLVQVRVRLRTLARALVCGRGEVGRGGCESN